MYYLNIDELLEIHESIISEFWWLWWIKDKQQLESILQHLQNIEYYPTIIDKLTHLFFGIIKFHCFNDWNKRTAIWAVTVYLELNDFIIPDIFVKLEDIAIWVAKWEITKDTLSIIFKTIFISFNFKF